MKVHLGKKVIDYNTQGEWKIQLSMTVNFIMRTKSDNTEIITVDETDNIIKNFLNLLFQRYQEELEQKMRKGSNFIFDSADLLE